MSPAAGRFFHSLTFGFTNSPRRGAGGRVGRRHIFWALRHFCSGTEQKEEPLRWSGPV